jgi:dienelactone hydrolase
VRHANASSLSQSTYLPYFSIADQFAANGYYTIIPDVFRGNEIPFPMPPDFDFPSWKANKMPREGDVDPIFGTIIKYLRGELGVKRLGGVGYCFGGKYVCRWLKPGGLDAGFTAHPSFVEVDELKGIMGPLSIAAAGECAPLSASAWSSC